MNVMDSPFIKRGLIPGRMISGSKSGYRRRYPDNTVYFNANIFVLGEGKIWWGDLDLTLDTPLLEEISKEMSKKLYVLSEMDGRFENENADDAHILSRAVSVIE